MNSPTAIIVGLILGTLLGGTGDHAQGKNSGGHGGNHRGGQAGSHGSNIGGGNSNAQWSADPSRGWVRAGERSELKKSGGAGNRVSDKGKHKAKAKSY